jgi:hypothetical protein
MERMDRDIESGLERLEDFCSQPDIYAGRASWEPMWTRMKKPQKI